MNKKKSNKKSKKFNNLLNNILLIIYTMSNIWLIINIFKLNGIETILRIILIIVLFITNLFLILYNKLLIKKKKIKKLHLFKILLIILSIIFIFISYNADKVFSALNNLSKDKLKYSSSIVTLENNNISNIKDINNIKIGIIKDENSKEGYIIPKLIIKENNLKNIDLIEYEDYISILNDLYSKDIDASFLPTNYKIMFNSIEKYHNIESETKVIITKSKTYKNENIITSNKKLTEPFTVLLMGVDSVDDELTSSTTFNGDALMLITFNPNTLNATILSIPRDTFVPIACFKNKYENKITHAAWQGESCMIDTIEDLTKIEIDYYVKINFKGVVDLVDALGGIDVEVPFSFCEQDSKRRFGKNMIYVDEGLQNLNGQQALALARHRKETPEQQSCGKKYLGNTLNDIVRGQNQQLIIKGMLNKIKSINSLNDIYNILNAIEKSMDTNISTNNILSLYNVLKNVLTTKTNDISDLVQLQRLYLSGYDQYIYDENLKLTLYNYIYYRGSLDDIVKYMKINLELIQPTLIKEFTYSINEEYEEKLIGKGNYKIVDYIETLPNFINKSKAEVIAWALKKDVNVTYNYEENEENNTDTVIKQNYPYGYRVKNIKNLTITLAKKTTNTNTNTNTTTYYDCTLKENSELSECLFKDFVGKSLDTFKSWYNKLTKYNINIPTPTYIEIDEDSEYYDEDNLGNIIKQSIKKDTLLTKVEDIIITYIKENSNE